MRFYRHAAVTLLALGIALPVAASEFTDYRAAVKPAWEHLKGAQFYLRTKNTGVAVFELQYMQTAWEKVLERFSSKPPDIYADDPEWQESLIHIRRSIEAALKSARAGDGDNASAATRKIQNTLAELRRRNGVFIFSDCVAEMNAAMSALYRYRHNPPDFDSLEEMDQFKKAVAITEHLYRKCRNSAPAADATSAEFGRMFDESIQSFERLWPALRKKDKTGVTNILREIRSFDRMIFLRFG